MADSTDSEVQFNPNVNRAVDSGDEARDAYPMTIPNRQPSDDVRATDDWGDVDHDEDDINHMVDAQDDLMMDMHDDTRPDTPDDLIADDEEDDEVDEQVSPRARQPFGYRPPKQGGGLRGDGDGSPVPAIVPDGLNQRGRPRYRLADKHQRRYSSDECDNVRYDANPIPRRRRHVLPSIQPESYDGNGDWEGYLSHFTNCADLGGWTDEERTLALASCLSGPAQIFYLGLKESEQKVYRFLVNRFHERFGSKKQQARYITKFESRGRSAGESIASFGDDLRLIAQRAYSDLDVRAQDSLALHQFYKTLSPEMKCRCIDRDCKTIEQAVEVVERYEFILGVEDTGRANVRTISSIEYLDNSDFPDDDANSDPEITIMEQVQEILARLEHLESRLSGEKPYKPEEIFRRRDPRRGYNGCYLCQSLDHYARDCPRRTMRQ